MLTEVEKAYFAGLIDGEGSISLVQSHAKRTRGRYVYPLVRIANTDEDMLLWCKTRGPQGSRHYCSRQPQGHKPVGHIGWACQYAIELLRAVEPYLITKKARAKIVIDLWEGDQIVKGDEYWGNGHPIPPAVLDNRRRAFEELAVLNRRGA